MRVFVTVGTTGFDKLVDEINTPPVLKQLERLGYDEVSIQTGSYKGSPDLSYDIKKFSTFHYKDSIEDELKKADLVISHAGAGSCMEVLRLGKPLVVVVNRDLMDDHQSELASQLTNLQHACMCDCSSLLSTLSSIDMCSFKKYQPGNPQRFIYSLNHMMLNSSPSSAALFVSVFALLCMLYPLLHAVLSWW